MCDTPPDEMAEDSQSQASEQPDDASAPPVEAADETAPSAPPEDPLQAARAELDRVRNQLLRTAADFDNYRKRTRRELVDAERTGREDAVRQLLPVFDNLERAASHTENATEVRSLAEGIALVLRQFLDTLGKLGVERVPAVGCPFDPVVHEAIQHLESAEADPGMVTVEVQAGYRMGDRLLRPALVVVAKPPTGKA
jgi:molecular chaperone GrpE